MRPWLPLVLACGCNRIFGIGTVEERVYDAPLDASPVCPDDGTPPMFRHYLHQVDAVGCYYYTPTDTGIASAICHGQLWTGPIGMPLAMATIEPPLATNDAITDGHVTPEADLALLFGTFSSTVGLEILSHDASRDVWHPMATVPVPYGENGLTFGAPTRGPTHHLMAVVNNTTLSRQEIEELAGSGTTWSQVATYLTSELGVISFIGAPSLTPDGLRMVYAGLRASDAKLGVLYTARLDTSVRFGPGVLLDTVPPSVIDPVLTEDCGTLYFDALQTILYYQQ